MKTIPLRTVIISFILAVGTIIAGIWFLTRAKGQNILIGSIFILMGLGMLYTSLRLIFFRRKGLKQIEWLKQYGKKAEAMFFKVDIDYGWEEDRPDRYFIICKWTEGNTGREYTFTSHKAFDHDPTAKIPDGKKFTVWYDPTDPEGKNYMETDFLL